MPIVTAIESVKQTFQSTPELSQLMETFRRMVNDSIKNGLENNISTMKKLSNLAYKQLTGYNIMSYYKLCAISHAAGILASRKKSIKRGLKPRHPYATRTIQSGKKCINCIGTN
jgi:predicted transposase